MKEILFDFSSEENQLASIKKVIHLEETKKSTLNDIDQSSRDVWYPASFCTDFILESGFGYKAELENEAKWSYENKKSPISARRKVWGTFYSYLLQVWILALHLWATECKVAFFNDLKDSDGKVIRAITGENGYTSRGTSRSYDNGVSYVSFLFFERTSSSGSNFKLYNNAKKQIAGWYISVTSDAPYTNLLTKESLAIGATYRYAYSAQIQKNANDYKFGTPAILKYFWASNIYVRLMAWISSEKNSFIFWGSYTTYRYYSRLDYLTTIQFSNYITSLQYNRLLYHIDDSYLFSAGYSQTFVAYIDKTTLQKAQNWNIVPYSTMDYQTLDNLNVEVYYYYKSSTVGKVVFNMANSGTSINAVTSTSTGAGWNGLMNLDTLNYLLYFATFSSASNSFVEIVRKVDMAVERLTTWTGTATLRTDNSFIEGYMVNSSNYFFGAMFTGNSVNFYTIEDSWTNVDSGIWEDCKGTTYLNNLDSGNYWLDPTEFPVKFGANLLNKRMVSWLAGWNLWINNYTFCTLWDFAGGYQRDQYTGKWYKAQEISPGSGVNTNVELLVNWSDSNWFNCKTSYLICLEWKSGYKKLDTNNTCSKIDYTPYFGQQLENPTILRGCRDITCDNWALDYRYWTKCVPGYRLSRLNFKCYNETTVNYLGINPMGAIYFENWVVPNCRKWNSNYQQWTECMNNYLAKETMDEWVANNTFVKAYGIDRTEALILRSCESGNCNNCYADYKVWTECNKRYALINAKWVRQALKVDILIQENTKKNEKLSESYVITVTANSEDEYANKTLVDLFAFINRNSSYFLPQYWTPSGKYEASLTKFEGYVSDSSITLNFAQQIILQLENTDYNIKLGNSTQVVYEINGDIYSLSAFGYSFKSQNLFSIDQINDAKTGGQIASYFIGASPNRNASSYPLNMFVGADPTGLLVYFTQNIKLYWKFKYINVKFGIILESFLDSIEEPTPFITQEKHAVQVYNAQAAKGTLTTKSVPLDFRNAFSFQIVVYFITWTIKLLHVVYLKRKFAESSGWGGRYRLAYYVLKRVHFVIFNLVFIEFFFFGTRGAYQSKNLSFSAAVGYIWIQLMLFDIILVALTIFNEKLWDQMYERMKYVHDTDKSNGIDSEIDRKKVNFSKESESINGITKGVYWMRGDSFLIFIPALNLRVSEVAFKSKFARAQHFLFIIRLALYQILIVGGQTCTGLIIWIALGLEISLWYYDMKHYRLTHFLKSAAFLIVRTARAVSMILFLFVLLTLNFAGYSSVVSYGTQKICRGALTIAIIMDYGLLFINVGLLFDYYYKLIWIKRGNRAKSPNGLGVPQSTPRLKSEGSLKKQKEASKVDIKREPSAALIVQKDDPSSNQQQVKPTRFFGNEYSGKNNNSKVSMENYYNERSNLSRNNNINERNNMINDDVISQNKTASKVQKKAPARRPNQSRTVNPNPRPAMNPQFVGKPGPANDDLEMQKPTNIIPKPTLGIIEKLKPKNWFRENNRQFEMLDGKNGGFVNINPEREDLQLQPQRAINRSKTNAPMAFMNNNGSENNNPNAFRRINNNNNNNNNLNRRSNDYNNNYNNNDQW